MEQLDSTTILQIFCGRLASANIKDHPGQVFTRMSQTSWNLIIDQIYDWVYLLGVFDYRGEIIVTDENNQALTADEDRVPSLFAISNHRETHPILGTVPELKNLIQVIHESGGKVMLDFVANHTATTHPWVKTNPEYYKHGQAGLIREFSQDVFPLDYNCEAVSKEMKETLLTIAAWGADGVRCDMAHLVPVSFWSQAIGIVKDQYPRFVFLAEAYSNDVFDWQPLMALREAGFDSIYDEFLYRNLKSVFAQGQPFSWITDYLNFLTHSNTLPLTHYPANHDDPLVPGADVFLETLVTLMACLAGATILPQGVLTGMSHRIAHHQREILAPEHSALTRIPEWFENLRKLTRACHPLITKVEAVADGRLRLDLKTDFGPGSLDLDFSQKPGTVKFTI